MNIIMDLYIPLKHPVYHRQTRDKEGVVLVGIVVRG